MTTQSKAQRDVLVRALANSICDNRLHGETHAGLFEALLRRGFHAHEIDANLDDARKLAESLRKARAL